MVDLVLKLERDPELTDVFISILLIQTGVMIVKEIMSFLIELFPCLYRTQERFVRRGFLEELLGLERLSNAR